MKSRHPRPRLVLARETLRRLTEEDLRHAAGAAATNGAPCDRSLLSDCATCACPPPP